MPVERMHRRMADPGLQPERTALAWFRTLLGYGALLALALRHSQQQNSIFFWAIFALLATIFGVFYRFTQLRKLMNVTRSDFSSPHEIRAKGLIALAVCGLALLLASVHLQRCIDLIGGLSCPDVM